MVERIRELGLSWRQAMALFARPQPVTLPMIALFAIVPGYLVIGAYVSQRTMHAPEIALDGALSLDPSWSMVYLSLFLAALLPAFVVHQQELIRRVIWAYLAAWLVSYAFFLAYPTVAPRHAKVTGGGFSVLALRMIYASDEPCNCFPSLHVAQCFLAALSCHRVHRGVGLIAGLWAVLVSVSTLYTKQHYVLDVMGGVVVALLAYFAFLRGYPRSATPEFERRLAPLLALAAFGLYGALVAGLWFCYLFSAGA